MKAAKIFNFNMTLLSADPASLARWYEEKFDLEQEPLPQEMIDAEELTSDSIILGNEGGDLCIIPRGRFAADTAPLIIYADAIEEAHEFLSQRRVGVGPLEADSAGARCFFFQDPDGNRIEVSKEIDEGIWISLLTSVLRMLGLR